MEKRKILCLLLAMLLFFVSCSKTPVVNVKDVTVKRPKASTGSTPSSSEAESSASEDTTQGSSQGSDTENNNVGEETNNMTDKIYSTSSTAQIKEDVTLLPMTAEIEKLFSVAAEDKNIKFDNNILYYFNLHKIMDDAEAAFVSAKVRRDVTDMIFCLQGIVNRDKPRLFIHYLENTSGDPEDWAYNNGKFYPEPDKYWWEDMRAPGGFLSSYNVVEIKSVGKILELFKGMAKGIVLWDSEVPATNHVASTIAGVEDLMVIRYDVELGVYDWVVRRNKMLPVKRNLVDLFSGTGNIPETTRKSTQSKKCDSYIWALENYLKKGKTNPKLMTYFIDGVTSAGGDYTVANSLNLPNKDYYITNRAFFFDLCVWEHIYPTDDKSQPLGTDYKTLTEILRYQNLAAKGDVITIGGFVPFTSKYTQTADGSGAGDVATEWRSIRVFSEYYAQIDADVYHGTPNVSIYSKIPLKKSYTQNANKNPTVKLENKNYIMFYMGDYDSAAFFNTLFPGVWDDPARGEIPLNWSFNSNLKDRIPHLFNKMFDTKTPNDHFVSGDNGAGYLNIESLVDPNRPKGLYGDVKSWIEYNKKMNAIFDISVGGFSIFETPVITRSLLDIIKQFNPNGCGISTKIRDEDRVIDGIPFYEVPTAFDNSVNVPYSVGFIAGKTNDKEDGPSFTSYRTIWVKPSEIVEIVKGLKANYPGREYEIVDPYTFKKLYCEFYK